MSDSTSAPPRNPFKTGEQIHGFARGYFGRDSYDCRTVEAVGADWIVTRNTNGEPDFCTGDLQHLWYGREDRSFCDETCDARRD